MIFPKKPKYKNKKIEIDWYKFDSLAEAEYYEILKRQKANWEIMDFWVHPKYKLQDKFSYEGQTITSIFYIADFEVKNNDYTISVIDIKGLPTTTALLKRKLFLFSHWMIVDLLWLVKYKGQFVDYFENEARKRANKKEKSKKN